MFDETNQTPDEPTVTIVHNGVPYADFTIPQLLEAGIAMSDVVAGVRNAALREVLAAVSDYRARLSKLEAGVAATPERIAVWRTKAVIAGAVFDGLSGVVSVSDLLAGAVDFSGTGVADAISAIPDAARGFLEREAVAKGMPLIALLAIIKAKSDAFDGLGLLIDAMEAEAKAGLAAVPDEDVLSGGLDVFLNQTRQNAEAEFHSAVAQLSA